VAEVVVAADHIAEAVTIVDQVLQRMLVEVVDFTVLGTPTLVIRPQQVATTQTTIRSIKQHINLCMRITELQIIIILEDTTQPLFSLSITMATAITFTIKAMGITNTQYILLTIIQILQ